MKNLLEDVLFDDVKVLEENVAAYNDCSDCNCDCNGDSDCGNCDCDCTADCYNCDTGE